MFNRIKYIVSEWGFTTTFNTLSEATKYCVDNKLTDGEQGLLWVISKNRVELDILIEELEEQDYIHFKHIDTPNNWVWCHIDEEWDDATEVEDNGREDFEENLSIRLAHKRQNEN